jgi:hypothetical protein
MWIFSALDLPGGLEIGKGLKNRQLASARE